MSWINPPDELSICECCIFIVEYGDCQHGGEPCPSMTTFNNEYRHIFNGDDEPYFKWNSRCDTCGTTLGGNRSRAYGFTD